MFMTLGPEQLNQLAMNYDPAPILTALAQVPGGGNFLTMPTPAGAATGPGDSYESIVAGAPQPTPTPTPNAAAPVAPLSGESLRTLAAMNPQDQPRAPGAGIPGRPGPLNLQPIATGGKRPMSFAEILGR